MEVNSTTIAYFSAEAVNFTAHRMIGEYQQKFYQKHHKEVVFSIK